MAEASHQILRGLIDPATRRAMAADLQRRAAAGEGARSPAGELALLATPMGEALLRRLQPRVEAAALTPVTPSYSVAHLFAHGAVLPLHVDGDDCRVTLSITLDYRALGVWPLQLVDEEAVREVRLRRGEGVLFDAARLMHARRPFRGRRWTQLTLHYARAPEPGFG